MTDVQNRTTTAASSPVAEMVIQPPERTRLNHVEFMHWPGEGPMVIELFEALNCHCEVDDTSQFGRYLIVRMGPTPGQNDFFASEAEEEHLGLEAALQREIDVPDSGLAKAYAPFRQLLDHRPYRATHIGIRLPSVAVFDEVIVRLESLIKGKFAGRLTLGFGMTRTPEEMGGRRPMKQVWVWTNVISTGLLTTGQQIEIQTYQP